MLDLQELKARIDCRELIACDLGEPARRSERVWQWQCPFHPDGKTPSLTAWQDGWKCFGCNASGDAITWVQRRQGVDFAEALRLLGGEVEPLAERTARRRPHARPMRPLTRPPEPAWQERAHALVQQAEVHLWSDAGAKARRWLAERGITDEDMRTWHLGYWPADTHEPAHRWGLEGDVWLPRGIVIPCFVGGDVWYVKVRRPAGEPKYVHIRGGKPALYGADLLAGRDELLLTEGEFDCILLHRLVGDVLDVVTFGGASEADIRPWLAVLISYRRIWAGHDADEAGERARQSWYARTKRAHGLIPPAKDWTDAWKALGPDELRRYVLEVVDGELG